MRGLADLARTRIVAWMAANPKITQVEIARAVGVSQAWVSAYKTDKQDADIDQLDAIARVYGHTLMELFDLRPDPKEQALVDAYRALPTDKRELALQMLKSMTPQPSVVPRRQHRKVHQ